MPITVLHTAELSPLDRKSLLDALPGELEGRASHYRIHHPHAATGSLLMELRQRFPFDINTVPARFDASRLRLLITDMDSTLINIECVDELADFAGVKAEVAAITEAAMRGELDFAASLTQRVATLAGLDVGVLEQVYNERLQTNPGAESLIAGLKQRGVKVALVSGGFTDITERLTARLGLDYSRANLLEKNAGRLTGKVVGRIVDATVKQEFLSELCSELAIEPAQTIAMGDGANDLKMMAFAGMGVAYRAKPKVQEQADVVINHGGLDSVLHLL